MRKKWAVILIIVAFAAGVGTGMTIGSWEGVSQEARTAKEEIKATARSADEATQEVAEGAKEKWHAVKEGGQEAAAEAKEKSVGLWQRLKKAWKALSE